MPNRNYQKGRRFEWAVQKKYEDDGATVFRTAGSHGIADLIVFHVGRPYLVQCKSGYLPSPKEREELRLFAMKHNCIAVLAINRNRKTQYHISTYGTWEPPFRTR